MRDEPMKEKGSLSPLIIGALLIGSMLLGVIADSGRIFLAHRELIRVADSTALAAASALSLQSYYLDPSTRFMPLDRYEATRIAQAWITQRQQVNSQLHNLVIRSLTVEGGKVILDLSAEVTMTSFYRLSGSRSILLVESASAFSQRN